MKRFDSALVAIVLVATVSAASAGDRSAPRLGSSADSRQSARGGSVIRPPAPIPSSRERATVAPKTSSTDQHAAEFFRWKDQHANSPR
jgi:hypothetical protein